VLAKVVLSWGTPRPLNSKLTGHTTSARAVSSLALACLPLTSLHSPGSTLALWEPVGAPPGFFSSGALTWRMVIDTSIFQRDRFITSAGFRNDGLLPVEPWIGARRQ
jgi:hypothetical protein